MLATSSHHSPKSVLRTNYWEHTIVDTTNPLHGATKFILCTCECRKLWGEPERETQSSIVCGKDFLPDYGIQVMHVCTIENALQLTLTVVPQSLYYISYWKTPFSDMLELATCVHSTQRQWFFIVVVSVVFLMVFTQRSTTIPIAHAVQWSATTH